MGEGASMPANGGFSRRKFLGRSSVLAAGAWYGLTGSGARSWATAGGVLSADHPPDAAIAWVELAYDVVKAEGYEPATFPAGFTPPSAARAYGYLAIAMYEAVVGGMPGFRSLSGQLNGMPSMPQPSGVIDWPTALAAAAGATLAGLAVTDAS